MKRSILISAFALAGFPLSAVPDEVAQDQTETVVIPLDRIWTGGASGLRSLRDLEPEYFFRRDTRERIKEFEQYSPEQLEELKRKAEQSLTLHIERAMRAKKGKAKRGFAVAGTGREALRGVYDVLVKGRDLTNRFPSGSELSIVFFTHPSETGVLIERIERRGKLIQIHYTLAYHGLAALTWNLALIPLGELSPGKYRVEVVRSKKVDRRGFPAVDPKLVPFIVCQPFSFVVTDHP